jgi:hypothetical protein
MAHGGAPALCATFRGRGTIAIGAGAGFRHGSAAIARLLVDGRRAEFRLVDGAPERDVMSIRFSLPGRKTPRAVCVTFTPPVGGIVARLTSRKPVKGPVGWRLDMGGRFARGSIKNAVMVDDEDKECIVARMTAGGEMEVEANPQIGQLMVFAFALASFICRL